MGYACPVCGDPQADGEHLANHLAFTAMLGDADHEDWLDERVPDWGETDPAELAGRVADHAEEREFPQVFEDTTGERDGQNHAHDHDGHAHGHGDGDRDVHGHDDAAGARSDVPDGVAPGGTDPAELFDADEGDRDPSEVLAEARELTRRRRADAGRDGSDDGGDAGDEDAGSDAGGE